MSVRYYIIAMVILLVVAFGFFLCSYYSDISIFIRLREKAATFSKGDSIPFELDLINYTLIRDRLVKKGVLIKKQYPGHSVGDYERFDEAVDACFGSEYAGLIEVHFETDDIITITIFDYPRKIKMWDFFVKTFAVAKSTGESK